MSDYPEHDKLQKAREELRTQEIGEFVEWLESEGYRICERVTYETLGGFQTTEFLPMRISLTDVLAKYAEVDMAVIEREKRQMLDELRAANER